MGPKSQNRRVHAAVRNHTNSVEKSVCAQNGSSSFNQISDGATPANRHSQGSACRRNVLSWSAICTFGEGFDRHEPMARALCRRGRRDERVHVAVAAAGVAKSAAARSRPTPKGRAGWGAADKDVVQG